MIKYVFLDMDNTIAENTTCDDVDFYEGLYLSKRPISFMIEAVDNLYSSSTVIILSTTQGGKLGASEKCTWLINNVPDRFLSINPLLVSSAVSKEDVIFTFAENNNISLDECLIIDDKKSVLQKCKSVGICVKYPQQIMCDYEHYLKCLDTRYTI